MTLDSSYIWAPYTYYMKVSEGAGLYVFPEELFGVSDVSGLQLYTLAGNKVLTPVLNTQTDRSIP